MSESGPDPQADPADADANLPARLGEERLNAPVARMGLFGVQDTPDTSGFGLLRVYQPPPLDSPRPYGSYFDEIADTLGLSDAIERVVV
ncbi:MAG TPA: NADH-quinone oxidoreductase subunit C, partial [Streptosporangiaceae bacterium]|nr:NADH-quinone oxidoreductase subunit C [Streptosporangiaceae bacterium]